MKPWIWVAGGAVVVLGGLWLASEQAAKPTPSPTATDKVTSISQAGVPFTDSNGFLLLPIRATFAMGPDATLSATIGSDQASTQAGINSVLASISQEYVGSPRAALQTLDPNFRLS
jgi:hypothetical protein